MIEIISYGSPDPSIRQDDLDRGVIRARRYRNRRIGEFLKELNLIEGKGTGIPTIKKELENNGSPAPIFDTDGDNRRFFLIEFTIHPDFVTNGGIQDNSHISRGIGSSDKEINHESNYDGNNHKTAIKKHLKVEVSDLVIDRIIEVLNYCINP